MSKKPTSAGRPIADYQADAGLVRNLLADQHPDLASRTLREIDSGWDNWMFRLGRNLAVRLPRRAPAAELIVREQLWLPRLAEHLPLPVPAPIRLGEPGRGYPCRWSVVPWLPGSKVGRAGLPRAQARPFAAFLGALHRPAPGNAPSNPLRGVPLARRAEALRVRMDRLAGRTPFIGSEIRRLWSDAIEAPLDLPATWLHGDLHPGNVLVRNGAISGIIDWGDLAAGDPATDLAAVWMLFDDPKARAAALEAYSDLSVATLARARGWAVFFGVTLLDAGLADDPGHAAIGERTLLRVAEDGGVARRETSRA